MAQIINIYKYRNNYLPSSLLVQKSWVTMEDYEGGKLRRQVNEKEVGFAEELFASRALSLVPS